MAKETIVKNNKWWALVIGVGLMLLPIHNKWITGLATNSKGETLFFLPAFGYLLLIMGTGLFLLNNWEQVKKVSWENQKVFIPLLVIVGAIGLSGISASSWQGKLAPLGMGIALLGLYLASRILGKSIFIPLAIGAGIVSLGVIIYGILFPGQITGGFIFEQNYDIVVGYVLLGIALFIHKWQWILAGLGLVAMFLTGSPEAIFALGVLALVVLIRKDWDRKLILAIAPVLVVSILWFSLGNGQKLYAYANHITKEEVSTAPDLNKPVTPIDKGNKALTYRLVTAKEAMTNIKPLGEGYSVTVFWEGIVHNVPLVIVQQLGYVGILAAVAWLWIMLFCLVKTRWKYAFAGVLALSVFDHYIWTQIAPLWWCLVGVSTTNNIKSDYIFRKEANYASRENTTTFYGF